MSQLSQIWGYLSGGNGVSALPYAHPQLGQISDEQLEAFLVESWNHSIAPPIAAPSVYSSPWMTLNEPQLTYEIMDAESIGLTNNQIVLGKLSGRNAFKKFSGLFDLQQLPFLLGHKTQIVRGGAKRRLSLFGF